MSCRALCNEGSAGLLDLSSEQRVLHSSFILSYYLSPQCSLMVVQRSPPNHLNPKVEDHTRKQLNPDAESLSTFPEGTIAPRSHAAEALSSWGRGTYHRLPLQAWHLQHHTKRRPSVLSYIHHPLTLPPPIRSTTISRMNSRYQDNRSINIPSTIPCTQDMRLPPIRKVRTTIRRLSPGTKMMCFKLLIAGDLAVVHMCVFDRLSAVRDRQGNAATSAGFGRWAWALGVGGM